MYAIVRDRGRQYKMREGDVVRVDLTDKPPGSEMVFDDVLLVSAEEMKAGRPAVEGASVVAEVLGEEKGPKLKLLKQRRVNRSKTRRGHRQRYTLVRVKEIRAPSERGGAPPPAD